MAFRGQTPQVLPVFSALIPASQPTFLTLDILCWEGHTLICRVSELDKQVRSCSLASLGGAGSSESAIACHGRVLESQNLLVWLAFKLWLVILTQFLYAKMPTKVFLNSNLSLRAAYTSTSVVFCCSVFNTMVAIHTDTIHCWVVT